MKKKKIESTIEAWESGALGADEAFVSTFDFDNDKVDEAFELQAISVRMRKQLISDLKVIAQHNGLGYQTLMKQILERFAQAELRKMAREFVESAEKTKSETKDATKGGPDSEKHGHVAA